MWSADPTRIFNSEEVALDDIHWQLRALVVFGDGVNDPLYLEQMELMVLTAQLDLRDQQELMEPMAWTALKVTKVTLDHRVHKDLRVIQVLKGPLELMPLQLPLQDQ